MPYTLHWQGHVAHVCWTAMVDGGALAHLNDRISGDERFRNLQCVLHDFRKCGSVNLDKPAVERIAAIDSVSVQKDRGLLIGAVTTRADLRTLLSVYKNAMGSRVRAQAFDTMDEAEAWLQHETSNAVSNDGAEAPTTTYTVDWRSRDFVYVKFRDIVTYTSAVLATSAVYADARSASLRRVVWDSADIDDFLVNEADVEEMAGTDYAASLYMRTLKAAFVITDARLMVLAEQYIALLQERGCRWQNRLFTNADEAMKWLEA